MRIGRTFTFDSAHYLPNYDGKCANLHGHTYHLTVEIEGPVQKGGHYGLPAGMVMDFGMLKDFGEKVLERYDHHCLNDILDNPTAENLVIEIYRDLARQLPAGIRINRLVLWETPTSYVIATEEDCE